MILADDAVLLREGLVRLLTENGHDVVAVVGDGPSFVDVSTRAPTGRVHCGRPDAAVAHRRGAAGRGTGPAPSCPARRSWCSPSTSRSSYADDLLADRVGAIGYLLKDRVADIAEFLDALHRVAAGGTVLDPEVVAQLLVRRRADDPLDAADRPASARCSR